MLTLILTVAALLCGLYWTCKLLGRARDSVYERRHSENETNGLYKNGGE